MKFSMDQDRPTLATLVAVIAQSPIAVRQPVAPLPPGFEAVDAAILDWIVAEGRRLGRALVLM
jgi:hypothetical protein